ncbi:MAG: crotonase/enoyl-CoA hydratase family protein [Deltaproteobacteria bacterium]|nr:crotonase/enoyl-CoA hydratase family protein [Deltaproteobacteria bacterium]
MTNNSPFTVKKEGFIAWLTLNRPEKRNTMNEAFFAGLKQHFESFDTDPDVRVVVIKAEGKSFTAGLDLLEMGSTLQGTGADARAGLQQEILRIQECFNAVEKCRKPVIAAAHSHCIGGGVDLLSASDVRIATRDAVFSIRETRIAIVADLGTLQRLPTIIGHGWFRELALTGRDFTAEEALKMGFITHLCDTRDDLYAKAAEIGREIATCSPLAVQGVKDVILYSRDKGVHAGLEYVAQKNAALLPSEDMMEAFQAFMEKRTPDFKGK